MAPPWGVLLEITHLLSTACWARAGSWQWGLLLFSSNMSLSRTAPQGFALIAFPEKSERVSRHLRCAVLPRRGCWWSTPSPLPPSQRITISPSESPDPCAVLFSPSFVCSSQAAPSRIDWKNTLGGGNSWGPVLRPTCKTVSLKLLATLGNRQQAQQMVKDWVGENKLTLHLWTLENWVADYFCFVCRRLGHLDR